MSNKYSQKLFDSSKKSIADAMKTVSKRAIQKTAKATGDLSGNKVADRISISKSPQNASNWNRNTKRNIYIYILVYFFWIYYNIYVYFF